MRSWPLPPPAPTSRGHRRAARRSRLRLHRDSTLSRSNPQQLGWLQVAPVGFPHTRPHVDEAQECWATSSPPCRQQRSRRPSLYRRFVGDARLPERFLGRLCLSDPHPPKAQLEPAARDDSLLDHVLDVAGAPLMSRRCGPSWPNTPPATTASSNIGTSCSRRRGARGPEDRREALLRGRRAPAHRRARGESEPNLLEARRRFPDLVSVAALPWSSTSRTPPSAPLTPVPRPPTRRGPLAAATLALSARFIACAATCPHSTPPTLGHLPRDEHPHLSHF